MKKFKNKAREPILPKVPELDPKTRAKFASEIAKLDENLTERAKINGALNRLTIDVLQFSDETIGESAIDAARANGGTFEQTVDLFFDMVAAKQLTR